MKVNMLDLFSGIGGFHLGLERGGFEVTSFFSEVDKYAVDVYSNNFKDSTYVGSVTDVRGADLPNIDIITFGSPCQDFSIAGNRKGMQGERSSLILEAIRLIDECRPSVFIWENVKGTFSSNSGADFTAILKAFANIGGYRLEWQLLNTAQFLPQNRERVYLVGYSSTPRGDWRGVFPIGKDDEPTAELREQQGVANTITARYDARATGAYIAERKLDAQAQVSNVSPREYGWKNISPAILARDYKDPKVVKQIGTRTDSNSGRQPYQQDRVYDPDGLSPALSKHKSDLNIKVVSANSKGYDEAEVGDGINLSAPGSSTRRGRVGKGMAQTLDTGGNMGVYTYKALNETIENFDGYHIRKLTPIECERLQGFPDNWTSMGKTMGKISNTQRYKMCGNAVTVDVVKAVAEKIKPIFTNSKE